jgi:hypothetical protein
MKSESLNQNLQPAPSGQLQSHQSKSGLSLSPSDKEYARLISEVNQLLDFKLTGEEIVEWTKEILRLAPNTPISQIRFVLDCFKTAKIEWVRGEGIQNLFRAFNETVWDGHGWTLKRRGVW